MTGSPPRVVVVVTPGCHLCETATLVVSEVCADIGVSWEQQQLAELDEARDIFRVDRQRLRDALVQ